MKIAIASSGPDAGSEVNRFFGRSPYFMIVEMKDGSIEFSEVIENPSASSSGGAGIKTAQIIANSGVKAVIASSPGPNAFEVLNKLGIKIYRAADASVEENIELFTQGNLEEIRSAARGRDGQ
ncbi:NifB/NifX family molybdenum-iron cluster-binding protein [Methanothermobacter sp.]|uniref:NifB/NifX family molybdenum-iron cluster-binding protein n=1 Tax=Methanothermobacter sp. TaxID=1884223 RepID=UPI003C70824F